MLFIHQEKYLKTKVFQEQLDKIIKKKFVKFGVLKHKFKDKFRDFVRFLSKDFLKYGISIVDPK